MIVFLANFRALWDQQLFQYLQVPIFEWLQSRHADAWASEVQPLAETEVEAERASRGPDDAAILVWGEQRLRLDWAALWDGG